MAEPALSASEAMEWLDETSSKWRNLIAANPAILALPCDIAGVKSAAELLQHIVAVELRYAERLAGLAPSDYATIPHDSADALYATHERAVALFRKELERTDVDWDEAIEFVTRTMGPARSTRKAVLFHAMLHSIRHYAQLATLVRQHGIKPGWPMDYLFMHMEVLKAQ